MSIRFDAAADRLTYSGSIPPPAAGMTITAWVKLKATVTSYGTWARVYQNTFSTTGTFSFDSDGLTGSNYFTAGGSVQNGITRAVDVWIPVAVSANGSTGRAYIRNVATSTTTASSGTVGTSTPAGICIAGRDSGDANDWFNGEVAQVRIWTGELTQAQIEAEWASPTPVVTSGIYANWPLASATDLTDTVAGRVLTTPNGSGQTNGTDDPPNVTSGATGVLAASVPLPTSALVTTVTDAAALAATVPLPAAALATTVTDAGALAASVPLPTVALVATATDAAALAASVPVPVSAILATVTNAGALAAAAPLPAGGLAATITGAGAIAAAIPLPVCALTTGTPVSSGVLAATVPLPTSALVAAVTDAGVLVAGVPLPVAALTGAVASPPTAVTGVLSASMPLPTGDLIGRSPILGLLSATCPLPVAVLAAAVEGGLRYPLHLGAATRIGQHTAGSATRVGAYRAGSAVRV